jgi:predicted MFS family arabinose efflux permease
MAATLTAEAGGVHGERARPAERRAVWLISSAHLISHFFQLAIIPLFGLLKTQLGVSYVQLGLGLTVFNVVSVLAQTPTGFLVDRIGSRRLLIGALVLGGGAFASFALLPTYPMLLAVMAVVGLANAVYHPADYDLLNAIVAPSRVGRAFSYHTFSGFVGSAIAPPLMFWLGTSYGATFALVVAGAIGVAVAIPLLFARKLETHREGRSAAGAAPKLGARELLTPAILSLTLFFTLLSLSQIGIQSFSIVALNALYHIPVGLASAALTAFLAGIALGVLGGGIVADKTARHADVAVAGFACCGLLTFAVGTFDLGGYAIAALLGLAGFCSGLIAPSRDMLVRGAAPPGAMGRTFGIVTTGFNIGGTIGPMLYGFLMDRGQPREVFYAGAALMLVTAALPLVFAARHPSANNS